MLAVPCVHFFISLSAWTHIDIVMWAVGCQHVVFKVDGEEVACLAGECCRKLGGV